MEIRWFRPHADVDLDEQDALEVGVDWPDHEFYALRTARHPDHNVVLLKPDDFWRYCVVGPMTGQLDFPDLSDDWVLTFQMNGDPPERALAFTLGMWRAFVDGMRPRLAATGIDFDQAVTPPTS